jgi:pilus assembly protein Flp/PilA
MNQLNMSNLLAAIKSGAVDFGRDEEGAQIVAVVSIALVIALSAIAGGGGPFGAFIARVTSCLTTAVCK